MLEIAILSLFPEYFRGPLETSILKRAQEKGAVAIQQVDIRDFTDDKHRRVDDRPYGGGPGMVMMPEPVTKAVQSARRVRSKVIYMSPQGRPLTAEKARSLAQEEHLVLLSGHYEGIDQRVIDREVDEEISIGDYVLTNGCLPALVLIDAVARFLPGVLGHEAAAEEDSFESGILDCPHYTRPVSFMGQEVPKVLQEGNHQKIAQWRYAAALAKTEQTRPDLYRRHLLSGERCSGQQKESALSRCGLATIRLTVASLKESLSFYKRVLGLRVGRKEERYALLSLGSINLVLMEGKLRRSDGPHPVLEVEVENSTEFDRIAHRATRAEVIHYGLREEQLQLLDTLTIELRDPDGYHWCLKCRQS